MTETHDSKQGIHRTVPAKHWEEALLCGNGTIGALLYGDAGQETWVLNHERLYYPSGEQGTFPQMGQYLQQIRTLNDTEGPVAAREFMLMKAKEHNWVTREYIDRFHPAFNLNIHHTSDGEYTQCLNYLSGECTIQSGAITKQHFVSRACNTAVLRLTATGNAGFELSPVNFHHDDVNCDYRWQGNDLSLKGTYLHGGDGFSVHLRFITKGGTALVRDGRYSATDCNEILVLAQVFADLNARHTLDAVPTDYDRLLDAHQEIHGELFARVKLDLGFSGDKTGDALLLGARERDCLTPDLTEQLYNASRYAVISSTGFWPPNLQGVWNQRWDPMWSSDYTMNTNLQLAISGSLTGALPEVTESVANLLHTHIDDFRRNAREFFNCKGIVSGLRCSSNGLTILYGSEFPGYFSTCCLGWMAHYLFEHYRFTGDEDFLRSKVLPLITEIIEFFDDFLILDEEGHYRITPCFSDENGRISDIADNATEHISVIREMLEILIFAAGTFGVNADKKSRYEDLLSKLPPYMIDPDGNIQEYAVEGNATNLYHAHCSNLYGLFVSREFDPVKTPKLWEAAKISLKNRMDSDHWAGLARSSHGIMDRALCCLRFGDAESTWELLKMAALSNVYPSLFFAHDPGPKHLNLDGAGSFCAVVDGMLVDSQPGWIKLLPALPEGLPRGRISGIRCRGQITIESLSWDVDSGVVEVSLRSKINQSIQLSMPEKYSFGPRTIKLIANQSERLEIA